MRTIIELYPFDSITRELNKSVFRIETKIGFILNLYLSANYSSSNSITLH